MKIIDMLCLDHANLIAGQEFNWNECFEIKEWMESPNCEEIDNDANSFWNVVNVKTGELSSSAFVDDRNHPMEEAAVVHYFEDDSYAVHMVRGDLLFTHQLATEKEECLRVFSLLF